MSLVPNTESAFLIRLFMSLALRCCSKVYCTCQRLVKRFSTSCCTWETAHYERNCYMFNWIFYNWALIEYERPPNTVSPSQVKWTGDILVIWVQPHPWTCVLNPSGFPLPSSSSIAVIVGSHSLLLLNYFRPCTSSWWLLNDQNQCQSFSKDLTTHRAKPPLIRKFMFVFNLIRLYRPI